jgi:SchA/CurD like domain
VSEWVGFLGAFDDDAAVERAVHDLVFEGQDKRLRAVEVPDAAAVSLPGTRMACALNRYVPPDAEGTPSLWSGLIYPLKAGHEDLVASIFANSGRPDHEVKDDDGNVAGRLLRTLVFVGPALAIRVIEVQGDLRAVSRHMSRQEPVRAFEREVEEHLAVPRDMVTPEGAMAFFASAGMRAVRVSP